jgi:hypothetical protein
MNRRIIYAILAVIAITALVFLVLSYQEPDDPYTVTLPSPAVESGGMLDGNNGNSIEVTPRTLKAVLGTLVRTESYSRTYTVTDYANGGQKKETALGLWQKGGSVRLSITEGSAVRNILVRDGSLYIWYNGYTGVFKSALPEDALRREIDRFTRLVTYEDILELPQEDILDAGYADVDGQPCIFAEYRSGQLDYVTRINIAVGSGLVVSIEKYDGDTLLFTMASGPTDLSTPPDSVFDIPS